MLSAGVETKHWKSGISRTVYRWRRQRNVQTGCEARGETSLEDSSFREILPSTRHTGNSSKAEAVTRGWAHWIARSSVNTVTECPQKRKNILEGSGEVEER